MLDDLRSAIEELELCPRDDELIEAISLADRLSAKITMAFGDFVAKDAWMVPGATSARNWLGFYARMADRDAAVMVRNAQVLASLPLCAEAYLDGRLSDGQVDVICGALEERLVPLFAAREAELLAELIPANVRRVALLMRGWKMRALDSLPDPGDPNEPDRSLFHSKTLDDRYETSGSFDPEGGAVIAEALRRAASDDAEGEPKRSAAQRRADALVDISRFFLAHSDQKVGGRHRPHLNVIVNLDDLVDERQARVVNGVHLEPASVSKLACDSMLRRIVVNSKGEVLDFGTASPSIPVALWNALVIRDEHCRFPGCDRMSGWCEGHHVVWFSRGGSTAVSNLVLVCSRHHHLLHLPGWGARLKDGAVFEVSYPSGQVRSTTPDRASPPLWKDSA